MPKYKTYWYMKLLGLFTAMAYITMILYAWINAEFLGYTYFTAGEPHDFIRNVEWIFGFVSVYILIGITKEELDKYASIR